MSLSDHRELNISTTHITLALPLQLCGGNSVLYLSVCIRLSVSQWLLLVKSRCASTRDKLLLGSCIMADSPSIEDKFLQGI